MPGAAVVADKAYGSRLIRQRIAEQGALAVIPSKSNARKPIPHNANLYRRRNIVERFFCTMKDMRRLATRYEKLSDNFLALRDKIMDQLSPHPKHCIFPFKIKCCVDQLRPPPPNSSRSRQIR